MITIIEILTIVSSELSGTNLRILNEICKGIFRLNGKVTGLNISRYTDNGGSYRNIQRFFETKISWKNLKLKLFEVFFFQQKTLIFLLPMSV